MEIITKSAQETFDLGRKIGSNLSVKNQVSSVNSVVYALVGDLGAGKTTFIQGFAKGLGIKNKIISPTFILMRKYGRLYHLDLYRLEGDVEREVKNLGVEEIWDDSKNVVIIEWAEKIKDMLPKSTKWIKFTSLGEDERRIVVE